MPQTILHILLATLLLVSSAGLTVNKHFCQMQLQDIAVMVKPPSCHSKAAMGLPTACSCKMTKSCCSSASPAQTPTCHKAAATNDTEKDDCCHNESEWVKSFVSQVVPHIQYNILPDFESLFEILPITLYNILVDDQDHSYSKKERNPIPLLHRHTPIWMQSFLC